MSILIVVNGTAGEFGKVIGKLVAVAVRSTDGGIAHLYIECTGTFSAIVVIDSDIFKSNAAAALQ